LNIVRAFLPSGITSWGIGKGDLFSTDKSVEPLKCGPRDINVRKHFSRTRTKEGPQVQNLPLGGHEGETKE